MACAVDRMCSSCTVDAVLMVLLRAGRSSHSSAAQLHQCFMSSFMDSGASVHPSPVPHIQQCHSAAAGPFELGVENGGSP